jgi:hypothetical protein
MSPVGGVAPTGSRPSEICPPKPENRCVRGPAVRAFALYMLDPQHLPVELLADVLGVPVSTGWLCNVQAEAASRLNPLLVKVARRPAMTPVVHGDETGTRVGRAKTTGAYREQGAGHPPRHPPHTWC